MRNKRGIVGTTICVLLIISLIVSREFNLNEDEVFAIEADTNGDGKVAEGNDSGNSLLTQEQMLEDYYYMWETLSDSSFIIEMMMAEGVDVEEMFLSFEEGIRSCESDREFYAWMNTCLANFNGIGHVGLIAPNSYKEFEDVYNQVYKESEWTRVLNDEKTKEMYNTWREILQTKEISQVASNEYTGGNVATRILEEDHIGYIKISSFRHELIEYDYATLMEFYEEIETFEHLIIDITSNSGGSTEYWERNIVEPLLREAVSFETHLLHKISDKNEPYFRYIEGEETLFKPIEQFNAVEVIDDTVLESATHYFSNTHQYEPISDSGFKGEIWILISETVYSASDTFAMFCKRTGFATLVGQTTRGNGGGGFDSAIMTLPNSRLLIRYSLEYTINSDGSSNQLYGTKPHILLGNTEEPLDVCLRLIDEKK